MNKAPIHAPIFAFSMILLASSSLTAFAGEVIGGSYTVNAGDAVENWTVRNNGQLILAPGAETNSINLNIGGLTSTGATIIGTNSNPAVGVQRGANANIDNTTIRNDFGRGLNLANASSASTVPPTASVSNSNITGLQTAVTVSSNGELDLASSVLWGRARSGTAIFNRGYGLGIFEGFATVRDGSVLRGDESGILLLNSGAGATTNNTHVVVDGSVVEGISGSSILVTSNSRQLTNADITIQNGSQLITGNGILLDVRADSDNRFGANADFKVDNSQLVGDVVVDELSSADVTLRNNASLTGQLTGVDNLSVTSGGVWKMVADGGVTNLSLDGGSIELSDGSASGFNTLTVGSLSGSGTFIMGPDFSVPNGDKLVVTNIDGAQGNHLLRVRSTGSDPTSENALTVVETNGGSANFNLDGGVVDLGVYKYYLHKVGDDWRLLGQRDPIDPIDPIDPVDPIDPPTDLAPSTETIIGLHAAAANVFYGEMGTLRQRLGDVRQGKGENGLWGRTFGRDLKGNGAARTDFSQSMWGLQAGAEREISLGGIPIIFGVFGGYSNSTVDFVGQSKGEIDSGYGGLYGTWLGNDGLYVDGLFKINRFTNDARAVMSDGTGASGDYGVTGFGGQIEIGKTYNLAGGWYAEPFAQLAALRIGSFDYQLDNGMSANADAYGSLQGRIGASFGFNHKLDNGSLFQPYVRVALAHEFIDSNKLKINTVEFNNALNGTRGEVGAGFAYQLNDALQIHADVDFAAGKNTSRNWGGNFGVSYKF